MLLVERRFVEAVTQTIESGRHIWSAYGRLKKDSGWLKCRLIKNSMKITAISDLLKLIDREKAIITMGAMALERLEFQHKGVFICAAICHSLKS